ncbi:MAG: hypothetical protein WCF90_01490 [Methanomicrobiales archaeon]
MARNYSVIAIIILLVLLLGGAGCTGPSSPSSQPATGVQQKTNIVGIDE